MPPRAGLTAYNIYLGLPGGGDVRELMCWTDAPGYNLGEATARSLPGRAHRRADPHAARRPAAVTRRGHVAASWKATRL
jgi:hypothetical protein